MIDIQNFNFGARDAVLEILRTPKDAVLAIIAGVEGPSYRPVGATMAIFSETRRAGSLSSGCIESDISLHAMDALNTNATRLLRYGVGSPFMDIQLPCGGGLDILLLPRPDRGALDALAKNRAARVPSTLVIDSETGAMRVTEEGETSWDGRILRVRFEPEIRFLVFGKGPESSNFAALTHSVAFPTVLFSPDPETLDPIRQIGCETRELLGQSFPDNLEVDDRTAIVLFFHDHDWEPPLLAGALDTPAFYIGAQGSQRARDARHLHMEALGVSREAISRLHGPVGSIPSARDARTLAVSVLAEILAEAMQTQG